MENKDIPRTRLQLSESPDSDQQQQVMQYLHDMQQQHQLVVHGVEPVYRPFLSPFYALQSFHISGDEQGTSRPDLRSMRKRTNAVSQADDMDVVIHNYAYVTDGPQEKDRISAIAVTPFVDATQSYRFLEAQEIARLQGALVGLEHLSNGMDVPVVSYEPSQEGGGITYIGKGRAELQKVAIESIKKLGADGMEFLIADQQAMSEDAKIELESALARHIGLNVCQDGWALQFDTIMQGIETKYHQEQALKKAEQQARSATGALVIAEGYRTRR
jgi:hypothetical protein